MSSSLPHALAFDLGTTFFKACLFDGQGELVALARTATPILAPQPGWAEMTPQAFENALRTLADELQQAAPAAWAQIGAVGISTQANTFCLLDEDHQAITPFLIWTDQRTAGDPVLAEQLDRLVPQPPAPSAPAAYALTGLPTYGTGFSPGRLLWLRREQPDLFARARSVHWLGDRLIYLLTGRHATPAGTAALTGLLDFSSLQWRQEARELLGITAWHLPEPLRGGTDLGPVNTDFARGLGLPAAARLAMGDLDQYAGAIGAGATRPGIVAETTGTVLAAVRFSEAFDPAGAAHQVFHGPAFEPGWCTQMRFGPISAGLLERYRAQQTDQPTYEQLGREAADAAPGGVQLDRPASAATREPTFVGTPPTRGAAVRAIFEGVAESLAEHLNALGAGSLPAEIRSVGGAARSDLWLQIKADRLGVPVIATACPEPTSLGAAILAWSARGGGVDAVARQVVRERKRFEPGAAAK